MGDKGASPGVERDGKSCASCRRWRALLVIVLVALALSELLRRYVGG